MFQRHEVRRADDGLLIPNLVMEELPTTRPGSHFATRNFISRVIFPAALDRDADGYAVLVLTAGKERTIEE